MGGFDYAALWLVLTISKITVEMTSTFNDLLVFIDFYGPEKKSARVTLETSTWLLIAGFIKSLRRGDKSEMRFIFQL